MDLTMKATVKFSNYYLASGSRILSIAAGLVLGGIIGLFTDVRIGILAGAGVAIVASFLLPLRLYLSDKPYDKLKAELTGPFLFDERVRFTVKSGSMSGFFVLTGSQMVFLSLDQGEHCVKLGKKEVRSVTLDEDGLLNIFLNDTQYIRVVSGVSEELFEIIRDNGWNVVGS